MCHCEQKFLLPCNCCCCCSAHVSTPTAKPCHAGLNDKSQFTRQIEKYADVYTSRVSNFLRYTVSWCCLGTMHLGTSTVGF